MKKLNVLSISMAEDEKMNLLLVREGLTGNLEGIGLYQVTLTMRHFTREGTELHPSISIYFVLAEGEASAINQVSDVAAGGKTGSGYTAIQNGLLTGVAHRIPLFVRGWGHRTV